MKKIRIEGIEGYYYIENDCLIYCYEEYDNNSKQLKEYGECDVSDLTELRVWEYNELVNKINKNYPKYKMSYLKGSFI